MDQVEEKVRAVIEGRIRPALSMHGGSIDLVEVAKGVVKVRLQGACAGCPGARATLRMVVEDQLRDAVPEVEQVVAV